MNCLSKGINFPLDFFLFIEMYVLLEQKVEEEKIEQERETRE
ncbi:hypothetical protein RV10_GL004736 [Enterococcus pallens]|nr:hypothetical protein RV10_GL004736 [Enterococcus pallens]